MERTMRDVVSDILTWPWFSEPHGYNFNGHLDRDPGGNVCIDPVEPTEPVDPIRSGSPRRSKRSFRPPGS
jgi:hypothetical protein